MYMYILKPAHMQNPNFTKNEHIETYSISIYEKFMKYQNTYPINSLKKTQVSYWFLDVKLAR